MYFYLIFQVRGRVPWKTTHTPSTMFLKLMLKGPGQLEVKITDQSHPL
jgi:hypothetical protein